MEYKSLYRVYRPNTFDDVVGQDHIVRTMKNVINTGDIAHAYLFCGPRGTGKTSIAKIMAKAVNCTAESKPCDLCDSCLRIKEGKTTDIFEIDAASNNGVDEIREIKKSVEFAPINSKCKVYIIDEVHMLSTAAFNALLKTLEEPPKHVIFILATTEPHKLPETILSRCQRYNFSRVSDSDLYTRVTAILEKEGIAYLPAAVKLLVGLADGGVRDALSLTEQAIAYSPEGLDSEILNRLFGVVSVEKKIELLNSVFSKETDSAIRITHELLNAGINIEKLVTDLILIIKDAVLISNVKTDKYCSQITVEQYKTLKINSTALSVIDVFVETLRNFKISSDYDSYFELAILKAIDTSFIPGINDVVSETPTTISVTEYDINNKEEPYDIQERSKVLSEETQVISCVEKETETHCSNDENSESTKQADKLLNENDTPIEATETPLVGTGEFETEKINTTPDDTDVDEGLNKADFGSVLARNDDYHNTKLKVEDTGQFSLVLDIEAPVEDTEPTVETANISNVEVENQKSAEQPNDSLEVEHKVVIESGSNDTNIAQESNVKYIEDILITSETEPEIAKITQEDNAVTEKVTISEADIVTSNNTEKQVEPSESPIVSEVDDSITGESTSVVSISSKGLLSHSDLVQNVLVQASKEQRDTVKTKWDMLFNYLSNPNSAKNASTLIEGIVGSASENAVIVVFKHQPSSDTLNKYNEDNEFVKFVSDVFGKEMLFIGVSMEEWASAKDRFITDKKNNCLIKPTPIVIKKKSVSNELSSHEPAHVEFAKSLFGENVEVKD